MNEKTEWKPKGQTAPLKPSGPERKKRKKNDSFLMKTGLAVAAGLIIGALAKGVKDSDYYD